METTSEDWDNCCPLCMEEMDSTDRQLKPCRCGYQICVWCWNHIMEMAEKGSTEGRCPACRTPYDKEKIVSTAVSCDRPGESNEKKQRPSKAKTKVTEGRKNLSNVRVIQRNLVYIVGIPAAFAEEETLERKEYFGQYGKILKISVSKTGVNSSQNSSAASSVSVYVTYVKEEDAMRCIQSVNGYVLDGKVLKACFGTTKYCNAWLKHMPCNNPDCLYLHDEGTREDSFTKEEMLAKYGSKSQHFHDLTHPPQRRSGLGLPPPVDAPSLSSTSSTSQNFPQNTPTVVGSTPKAVPLVANTSKSSSLPAAASWGSRSSGSSRAASGRSIVGPPASKPKIAAGLINLSTVSGSCTIRQSENNYDGFKPLKASNADGAQTSLAGASRLLERDHSAAEASAMIHTEGFTCNADDAFADNDAFTQVLDGLISHRKSLTCAEDQDHMYGASKEMKMVDPVSSRKFVDAEENSAALDILAGKGLKSPMGSLTPMSTESTPVDQEDSRILKVRGSKLHCGSHVPYVDCSPDSGMYAVSEILPRKSEDALQQQVVTSAEVQSVPDRSYGLQSTDDATVLPSSDMTDLSILSRSDNAILSSSSYPSEGYEEVSCNLQSRDPWSSSGELVKTDKRIVFAKDKTAVQSEDSISTQKTVLMSKADEFLNSRKKPINGFSEHEFISDMFSTGFDLWTDGSPQDLAQLLFNGKKVGFTSTPALQESANTWKSSSESKQSRFYFARQDEVNERTLGSNKLLHDRHVWPEKHNWTTRGNIPAGFSEVPASEQFLSRVPASTELNDVTASHLSNSKSPMMAPPGFSSVRASTVPPPGFSQHKSTDMRRFTETSHTPPGSLIPTSSSSQLEAANILADLELIDPAIMAVGKGKLPAGSRTTVPFANSPSLSTILSQNGPFSQQPRRPLDYQTHQDHPYRNHSSLNSAFHLGYSNQDLDTSLYHSSVSDAISQSRLMGQYHDSIHPHVVMQESVYANGGHGASKLRLQHSSSDEWNRHSEANAAGHQSVNDGVGRMAISQISLDRALQNRLEEFSLSKELSSKYFGDAYIPTGYEEQGPLTSARIGRYF